jgi:roadblock/LC7 domain-containing protein
MNWKDVAGLVSKIAPVLGGALLGPGGAAAGKLLSEVLGVESSPDKVLEALKSDPAAIVKIRELESNERIRLQELSVQADTVELQEEGKQLQAVNETMRAELAGSAGEAWYQKAWRPACGFAVATGSWISVITCCGIVFYMLRRGGLDQLPAALSIISQFASSISIILGIPGAAVGIAAWHRGKRQRVEAGEQPSPLISFGSRKP